MSAKAKKAVTSSSSASRSTATAAAFNNNATLPPTPAAADTSSSTSDSAPAVPAPVPPASPPASASTSASSSPAAPLSEQRCYCSDPRPLQSDLICSHNTASCHATHVSCLTSDHRVLTRSGWRAIAAVQAGEAVLSCHVATYAMQWKLVRAVVSHELSPARAADSLYRMQGDGMDVIATRDHRMLLARVGEGSNGQQGRPHSGYETVDELLRLEHATAVRAVLRSGVNEQLPVKVVIPGLERVCEWWWSKDGQLGLLQFIGFWLAGGHLHTPSELVAVEASDVEAVEWLSSTLTSLFPRCWRRTNKTSARGVSHSYFHIRCPPLYHYLLVMAAGPIGYNPLDPTELRNYPHFTRDDGLAAKEQQSIYHQPASVGPATSKWTEDAMLDALTAEGAEDQEVEEEGDEQEEDDDDVLQTVPRGAPVAIAHEQLAQSMLAAGNIVWLNNGQWLLLSDHWFHLKRWLGEHHVANVYSAVSRQQAIALLDGFCRADRTQCDIRYDDSGEPTGRWTCSHSSFPLINHLMLIGQLAGAAVDLRLLHTQTAKSCTSDDRTSAVSVDQWQLHFSFTSSQRAMPCQTVPLAQPVDVSDHIDARGYYQHKDDGMVHCIQVDDNSNFLTQRLSTTSSLAGATDVRAQPVFVGNCLRDNDGNPFTDYVLGRSCFLCAHCVNRKGFRHPTEMECTLDSRHGCFYEKRGFTKQREADATAAALAGGDGQHGRDKEDSKEEAEVVEQRIKADGARMEEDDVEQGANGHATHTNRRSTRTSVDKDSTSTVGAAAAVSNDAILASPWLPGSYYAASTSSSSAAVDSGESSAVIAFDDEPLEPKKAKRRGIRDADRKAKAKLVPRCTSPSHFLVDDTAPASSAVASAASSSSSSSSAPLSSSASSSAALLPSTSGQSRHVDKLRTDALLSSIASMYYRPRLVHPSAADVYVSAEYDRFEYPTVDSLLSPLRKASVLDEWTPMEVALFESGVCSYGKDFHAISRLMAGRKTCGQCVEFYYVWKKSGHYAMWKEYGKPVRRRTDSKAEQWRAVEDRMRGFSSRQDDDGAKRRRAEEAEEARERQRMGDNGSHDKKAKTESGSSEQHSSSVKMEEDSNASSGEMKAEGSVSAESSVKVS